MTEDEVISSSGNIYHDLGVEAPWWADHIEALEAENAKLKEALKNAAGLARRRGDSGYGNNGDLFDVAEICRAALGGEP